ncbi:Hypothetical predicted protein [Cloeon dipterum]|uniref:RING-type domain-containing protein n=1 Tax=Cloeon dipterum TaxID=197152 RepID=A0A8S1CLN8_9INSE|nr:Hypothetical predicted protein [Cloeon dipterum]
MDWIHCNNCSRQPSQDKGLRFQLTSCGHIFCSQCVESSTNPACKVCGSKCNCLPLSSNMPPEIQSYFSDPEETIRKALQIYAFQKGHRQRLVLLRANRSIENQLSEENKKLRAKLIEQAKYIAKLENKLIQFKQMTAALQTPLRNNMHVTSPRTPSFLSPAPSVSSQMTAGFGQSQQAEKRVSPHFAGTSDLLNFNRMSNVSSAHGKVTNSGDISNRQKCSPRERLVNYAPDSGRSGGKM